MGKVIYSLTTLFWLFASASCNIPPGKASGSHSDINWTETPFVIDGCKMYYNGKEFRNGWHIKEYEKIFGKSYRRVDSIGSYGFDNVFTFDDIGIMMLGKVTTSRAEKDTIKQINIVFDYQYSNLDYFDKKEGLTDSMQKPDNYARPKKFYSSKMLINGVALQFGPKGVTINEVNNKLTHAKAYFDQSVMKSYWEYHARCEPKQNDSTIVYSLVRSKDAQWLQQLEISRSSSIF